MHVTRCNSFPVYYFVGAGDSLVHPDAQAKKNADDLANCVAQVCHTA